MLECSGCHRHVRLDETHCPFCATALRTAPAPTPTRVAALVLSLGIASLACADRTTGDTDLATDSDTTTTESATETSESETTTNPETSTSTTTTVGDGDGDITTDEMELEEAAAYAGPDDWGDGDGDPWGDGDGDPSGDGDGDPELPCSSFDPQVLEVGANDFVIQDQPSQLESSCGAGGPEQVFSFVAPADGFYDFILTSADFDAAMYLVGELCSPLDEIQCESGPAISIGLPANTAVNVVVDSYGGPGSGTLEVTY